MKQTKENIVKSFFEENNITKNRSSKRGIFFDDNGKKNPS
jgi:hypothetical protein